MNYETTFVTVPKPVTILTTHGDIDGSNFQELIDIVNQLHQKGTRNLLLDLADTRYMSSSGLVALHSLALLMKGEKPLNTELGWAALREMSEGFNTFQPHLKLLNPQPRVDNLIEISGLKTSYEIFTDREAALASFQTDTVKPATA